jgi:hypothetical protein
VLGVELGEWDRLLRQFVPDLLPPSAMPALDDALRLAVPDAGVKEMDAELGADLDERARDVG